MARASRGNTGRIWVRPFATSLTWNQSNIQDDQICVDDDKRNEKDGNIMGVTRVITKNVEDKTVEVTQLFQHDMELKEEYKQLLVNAVAERIKRKMPEERMWKEIEKETGYDHRMVLNQMRETILKKIMSLLSANDYLENIPIEMQFSSSDWLFFDLILVHEQIDVINIVPMGNTDSNKEEPQCLQDLFELVKQYDVENLIGEALADAWTRLTMQYNSCGRQCSPMMLQLRWYQLKKITRSCFYNSYVHNTNQEIQDALQSCAVIELTVLQIAIAMAFNKILTQECPSWETLINERRVILSEEFSAVKSLLYDNKADSSQAPEQSNEPPLLVIKLDGNQMAMDFDKIKNSGRNTTVTEDKIVIGLDDDVEYAMKLQKMMDKSTEPSTQVKKSKMSRTNEKKLHKEESGEESKLPVARGVPKPMVVHEENEEKFKLHLLREMSKISDMRVNKFDGWMWYKLNLKFRRDCREIWYGMRKTIAKKVANLLLADDMLKDVPDEMRLSNTEWLFFDLTLVHQNTYSTDFHNNLESKCLQDLFMLVNEYQVENLAGEELVEAWIHLTLKYNRGGRQCSPMLLQLRWYRLKELSRYHVYRITPVVNRSKSRILIEIATKYQKIITQQWLSWSAHVQDKSIVLPEQFVMTLKKGKWKDVEPHDGWYLRINDVSSNRNTDNAIEDISANGIHIVSDLSECNIGNNSITKFHDIVEQTPKDLNLTLLNKTKQLEIIDLDSDEEINDILRKKVNNLINMSHKNTNVSKVPLEFDGKSGNIIEKLKNREDAKQTAQNPVEASITNHELTLCDSDDEMDKLLQEKPNVMGIELPKNLKTLEKIIGVKIDEFKKVNNSKIFGMEVEEVGIINKEMAKTNSQYEGYDELDFDDNNIEFEDDGIKFEDGSEYKTTNVESRTVSSSDADDDRNADETDGYPHIDPKLLMNTKVYTKKIDCMEVFKFLDYDSVNDKRVIEYVESESKALDKCAPKDADIESFRDQAISKNHKGCILSNDNIVNTSFEGPENRIKYTSWLLQKPKKRKYRSRQLFKNPDFNTELKTLTSGFLSSTRNRVLLKKCQPLTIDLHKTFEKKLVNGKMYLTRSDFKSAKATEIKNTKNEGTIATPSMPDMITGDQRIKLAKHIRELIATMTTDKNDESDLMSNVSPKLPAKRSKVINLPDKDQIRLINKSLLTAEITPRHQPLLNLPTVNITNSNKNVPAKTTYLSEKSPYKRLKTDLETSKSWSTNESFYCCWAREKIVITQENSDSHCSEHMCADNYCTCCCRLELVMLTSKQPYVTTKTNSPFPNLSNAAVTDNIQNRKISGNDSFKTKLSLDKIGGSKNISNSAITNNIQINKKINSNSSKDTKIIAANTAVQGRNLNTKEGTSFNKLKLKNPKIYSGPLLLKQDEVYTITKVNPSVVKATTSHGHKVRKTMPPLKKIVPRLNLPVNSLQPSESPTYVVLPPGVNFVRLGDEKLAVAINPGVQLDTNKLHSLMSVCASVNNTTPNQTSKESPVPPLLFYK